jgi:carboxymethylenebutenolidase
MIEKTLDITTNDGEMETFICHPERNGPSPAVFFLMDAHGVREELKDMARRLGTVGYYVLLPNLLPCGPRYDLWTRCAGGG